VEALVGSDAYRFLAREHLIVAQLSETLKARPEQLPERIDDLLERLRSAEKEIEKVRLQQLLSAAGDLAARAVDLGGVSFVGEVVDGAGGGEARTLALDVRGRMPADRAGAVLVIGVQDGKPSVVAAVNDAARSLGVSANDLVRTAATLLGGKGGGKDDVAQGGGTDASRVAEALEAVRGAIAAR